MLEIAQVRKSIRLVCQRLTTTKSDITLNLREGGPYPCLQWGWGVKGQDVEKVKLE